MPIFIWISILICGVIERIRDGMDAQKVDDSTFGAFMWSLGIAFIIGTLIYKSLDWIISFEEYANYYIGLGFFATLVIVSFFLSSLVVWDILSAETEVERRARIKRERHASRPKSADADFSHTSRQSAGDEYRYRKERFRDGGSKTNSTAGARDPAHDFAEMMRRASEAIKNVSEAKASVRAEWAARKAKESGLGEWDRQYFECMSMLLRERAKGFQGRPDNTEPTEDEKKQLSLPPP